MRERTLDSEICYQDLKDSLEILTDVKASPKVVRRELREFASLAKMLADLMRDELRRLGLGDPGWLPFDQWGAVAALFLELRNLTQHRWIVEQRMRSFRAFDASSILGRVTPRLAVRWETSTVDPFEASERPNASGSVGSSAADDLKEPTLPVVAEAHRLALVPPTPAMAKLLDGAGTDDIHTLAAHCFAIVDVHYRDFRLRTAGVDPVTIEPLASGGRRRRRRRRPRFAAPAP